MINMIILAQKNKANEGLLVIENVDKTLIIEITKMLKAINLNNKHSQNINIVNKNLKLIDIKKYWKYVSQI